MAAILPPRPVSVIQPNIASLDICIPHIRAGRQYALKTAV